MQMTLKSASNFFKKLEKLHYLTSRFIVKVQQ